jgi:hypothetical protein
MNILPILTALACSQHYSNEVYKKDKCKRCKYYKDFYSECKKGHWPYINYKHCIEY